MPVTKITYRIYCVLLFTNETHYCVISLGILNLEEKDNSSVIISRGRRNFFDTREGDAVTIIILLLTTAALRQNVKFRTWKSRRTLRGIESKPMTSPSTAVDGRRVVGGTPCRHRQNVGTQTGKYPPCLRDSGCQ